MIDNHIYYRLMLGAAAVTGGALVSTFDPSNAVLGGIVAVNTGQTLGSLGGNWLHQCGDDLLKQLSPPNRKRSDILDNHDLRKLTAKTLTALIRASASDSCFNKKEAGAIRKIARHAEPTWMILAEHQSLQALNEDVTVRFFAMSPESFGKATALDEMTWAALLRYLESEAHVLLSESARSELATTLRERFPHALHIMAKRAFEKSDAAYAALQLRLMRELMSDVRDILAISASTKQDVSRLFQVQKEQTIDIHDIRNSMRTLIAAVQHGAPGVARVSLGDRAENSSCLEDINEDHFVITTILETKIGVDEILRLLNQQSEDRHSRSQSNLVAAGAGRNAAFIGRESELMWLRESVATRSVVITAGAGTGKTELAREYANQQLSGPWKGIWWLDGSCDAELNSVRRHYMSITGRRLPPVPSGDDQLPIWLETVRRDIAQACSYEPHLLIVDNAESSSQIEHYRPDGDGRLIATTRRQPIPSAIGHTLELGMMSTVDAKALLIQNRPDLQGSKDPSLDKITAYLGRHPLALAYTSALLGRPPRQCPSSLLQRLTESDIGDESSVFASVSSEELGTAYRYGLAQSLGMLLDELENERSDSHDPVAIRLLYQMSFCSPDEVPLRLLEDAAHTSPEGAISALLSLRARSLISFSDAPSVHRLTQSLVRSRAYRTGRVSESIHLLLTALLGVYYVPRDQDLQSLQHTSYGLRFSLLPHALAAIQYSREWMNHDSNQRPTDTAELLWHLCGEMSESSPGVISFETGVTLAEQAKALELNIPEADPLEIATNSVRRARLLRAKGDREAALQELDRSIEWLEESDPDNHHLGVWYNDRASVFSSLGEDHRALGEINRSLKFERSRPYPSEHAVAMRLSTRASIRFDLRELDGARSDLDESIRYFDSQSPRNNRMLSLLYGQSSDLEWLLDRSDTALATLERAIEYLAISPGDTKRSLAINLGRRARILQDIGRSDEAARSIESSLAWFEQDEPWDHHHLAIYYRARSEIHETLGDYARSLSDAELSLTHAELLNPGNEYGVALSHARLASVLDIMDNLPRALRHIEACLLWYKRESQHEDEQAIFLSLRGSIRTQLGDHANALVDLNRSISLGETYLPRFLAEHAVTYSRRAETQHALGEPQLARKDADRAIMLVNDSVSPTPVLKAKLLASRALIRSGTGDVAGGTIDIGEAIAFAELGQQSGDIISDLKSLRAMFRIAAGELEGASDDLEDSISLCEKKEPPDYEGLAICRARRAHLLAARKSYFAAKEDCDFALHFFETNKPEALQAITEIKALASAIATAILTGETDG